MRASSWEVENRNKMHIYLYTESLYRQHYQILHIYFKGFTNGNAVLHQDWFKMWKFSVRIIYIITHHVKRVVSDVSILICHLIF